MNDEEGGRGGRKGEGNACTEETAVMFITHLYSHNDATIKDWDTITLPLQLAG